MKKHIQEPISLRQRSSLTKLFEKYGEKIVRQAMEHELTELRRKKYVPYQEEIDSFHDESEETIDIWPPAGPTPITRFLQLRGIMPKEKADDSRRQLAAFSTKKPTTSTAALEIQGINDVDELIDTVFSSANVSKDVYSKPQTMDSRFDVSRPLTAKSSPLRSPYEGSQMICQEETAEKEISKQAKTHHRDRVIIACNSSQSPSKSPPKVEKPLVEEKPWLTLDEQVARTKASEAARVEASRPLKKKRKTNRHDPYDDYEAGGHMPYNNKLTLEQNNDILDYQGAYDEAQAKTCSPQPIFSLSKRRPQLKADGQAEEEQVRFRKIYKVRHRRGFIPRNQPFKLWIEEHKKRIAEGNVPTKDQWVWEAVEATGKGESPENLYYAKRVGDDWELIYGKNFDPVFAERALREPKARRERWQMMKDKREKLRTKQAPGLEWYRLKALEKSMKAEAEAQAEHRRHETLDEEAKRLKDQRKRDNRRYRKWVEAQGGIVKERLDPEEQKAARREADTARKREKREEKKKSKAKETTPKE